MRPEGRPRAPSLGHLPGGVGGGPHLPCPAPSAARSSPRSPSPRARSGWLWAQGTNELSRCMTPPWAPAAVTPPRCPRPPGLTFRDPQLHGAALVLILVPHGGRVAGAPRCSAPGGRAPGAGYMAARAGAALPGAASGSARAPAPPPRSRPARPDSGARTGRRGREWVARGGGLCPPRPHATLRGTSEHRRAPASLSVRAGCLGLEEAAQHSPSQPRGDARAAPRSQPLLIPPGRLQARRVPWPGLPAQCEGGCVSPHPPQTLSPGNLPLGPGRSWCLGAQVP